MKICKKCNTENEKKEKVCKNCGSKLTIPIYVWIVLFLLVGVMSGVLNNLNSDDKKEAVVFDINSVLDKTSKEMIDIFTQNNGKPDSHRKPNEDDRDFGSVTWIDKENDIMITIEYYSDGKLKDNAISVVASRENKEVTYEQVLQMINLNDKSDKYTFEILNDSNLMLHLWVEIK